jgi:hypothetical protein
MGAIELGPDGIAELAHGQRIVFVRRADVRHVAVEHGFTAERPAATLLVAVAFLSLGGYLAHVVLTGSVVNGLHARFQLYALLGAGLFLLLGALMTRTLVRRGAFLRVATAHGHRKLIVHGAVDRDALLDAERRFGYAVDWSGC